MQFPVAAMQIIMKNNPRFILAVIFLCFFLKNHHVCLGADSISGNQTLTGDQTIISAGGKFELGFSKPGNISTNYYICMWYKNIPERTIVWVANRETPVLDRFSSVLRISDGNLVLFNESQFLIWSTNVSSTSSSGAVEAVLEDNGNLVLKQGSNNSQTILWQSFDHPAHTWLPGSKIAYNNITKMNTRLISWKTKEDPAPGLFNLELDITDNSYRILWNRSERYWTSGPWNENNKIFERVPEMRLTYIYDFHFTENENESYFTYSVKNTSPFTSRFVMDVSGQVKQQNWMQANGWNLFWSQPRQQCEVYAFCGAYASCNQKSLPFCNCLTGFEPKSQAHWDLEDYSVGCKRRTPLQCGNNSSVRNGERDKFLELSGMAVPDHSVKVGSAAECQSTCLSNCSCTAYSLDGNDCLIWIDEFLDLKQQFEDGSAGQTFYVRLAASELPGPKNKTGIVVGIAVGSAVGILVLLGLIVFVVLKQRRRTVRPGKIVEGSLMAYDYRYLQNATKNFSEKLGGGGFGSVFKGTLPDSTIVAVKQLEGVSQGEKQFRMEVSTIGTIQHVNLVRLRGFCSEGAKRLLVYDYMSNSSLDSHIFRDKTSHVLDWKTRYQIALGTARGLFYLHEKCRDCIIHCDIKPENILLDSQFVPKLADFGLAKLFGRDFSRVLTTMRGTRGYLAPEWISGVAITAKADIFSFGMMLFEFVSGRRNSEQSEDGKVSFFPSWAASVVIDGGDVLSLLDPSLERIADVEELTKVCRVACWCIQDDETQRPTMGQVVQILEGVMDVNIPPVPRSLQVFVDNQENVVFYTESSSSQSSQTRSNTSTASQAKSTTSSMKSV